MMGSELQQSKLRVPPIRSLVRRRFRQLAVDGDWPRFNPLWGSLDNTPRRHTYYPDVDPSAMPAGSRPAIDDLRATLLRIVVTALSDKGQ